VVGRRDRRAVGGSLRSQVHPGGGAQGLGRAAWPGPASTGVGPRAVTPSAATPPCPCGDLRPPGPGRGRDALPGVLLSACGSARPSAGAVHCPTTNGHHVRRRQRESLCRASLRGGIFLSGGGPWRREAARAPKSVGLRYAESTRAGHSSCRQVPIGGAVASRACLSVAQPPQAGRQGDGFDLRRHGKDNSRTYH